MAIRREPDPASQEGQRPPTSTHQRHPADAPPLPRDALCPTSRRRTHTPAACAEMAVAEPAAEPVAENVYEPPKRRMPRKDEDSDSEDEEKLGRYKRVTPKVLKKLIKEQELFKTPELNDKLYIHYHGFEKIEGLEEWTGCVRTHARLAASSLTPNCSCLPVHYHTEPACIPQGWDRFASRPLVPPGCRAQARHRHKLERPDGLPRRERRLPAEV